MFDDDRSFEDEVRRIARALWPTAAHGGAAIEDNRERDGIFITDECVHLLECTTSRSKNKAVQDVNKMATLLHKQRTQYATKAVKGWFVTLDEPTAEQRGVVAKHNGAITAVSYDQFRSQLIDARSYLEARRQYSFGSMQDPEEGANPKRFEYVELDMIASDGKKWSLSEITSDLLNGRRFVLLGDYGAGKSTTMREMFFVLEKKFRKNQSRVFPIALNLRNHHGQTNPAEALERHARNIGYNSPTHLVKAWRAGYAILLLDGFDEIATAGWAGQAKKLKDIRYQSMELLREFIRQTPSTSGIAVSGREHFFDSGRELYRALSLSDSFVSLSLSDFTDDQVEEYLQKKGWKDSIPSWLPTRPLLLGHLASKGLLEQVLRVDAGSTPAVGWDALLTRVCNREAEIEAGIDGETVRQLIERLATKARRDSEGIGPLQQIDIVQAFQQVCGYLPDDRGVVLLQRLPGLGGTKEEDGSREFIDRDLVDAARAGDVMRYIENPFAPIVDSPAEWQTPLGQLGRELTAHLCIERNYSATKLSTAIERAGNTDGFSLLCADIVQVVKEAGYSYTGKNVYIRDTILFDSSFGDEGEDFSRVSFQDCLFPRLELATDADGTFLPRFFGCYFAVVEGRMSVKDLPPGVFDDRCLFDSFGDNGDTNAAILDTSTLPLGVRVLLTILKKLYLQRGSGRKESALYRGLDHRAKRLVPEVLQLLRKEQLVIKSSVGEETVWLPTRTQADRVRRLVSAPNITNDSLLKEAGQFD